MGIIVLANEQSAKKTEEKTTEEKITEEKTMKTKVMEDTIEHVYNVDVTKSLDMAINHPEEDHSHYPAVVTNLKPGGQAELAGVKLGMHIHSINGCSCKDQEMQFVLDLIKECHAAKKELIIVLANEQSAKKNGRKNNGRKNNGRKNNGRKNNENKSNGRY